jgi:hypothetical protein
MAQLWVQLNPNEDAVGARKAPSWRQREAVEGFAEVRLEASLLLKEVVRAARAVGEGQEGAMRSFIRTGYFTAARWFLRYRSRG